MLNYFLVFVKNKLTTSWGAKWFYWCFLNFILLVSFFILLYAIFFLYPTSIVDLFIYIIFFWLGLILTPIYWCWMWGIIVLYICGIKIPFFFYPLGMGLVACRLSILIFFFWIILIPIRFIIFKVHKYVHNLFLAFLLSLISLYKKLQEQKKTLNKIKQLWIKFKKWVYSCYVYYMLKFQDNFPQYILKNYIRIHQWLLKNKILILLWYYFIRFYFFIKLWTFVLLYKLNIINKSERFYLEFINKNIKIIQKTQKYKIDSNVEIEAVLLIKNFSRICKLLNVQPKLLPKKSGYYLYIKQQKIYNKLYNDKQNKHKNK